LKAWQFDFKGDWKQGFQGAVDDLRVGMTLNPYMQVAIAHGTFDLVTPYFASNHLANQMKLNPEIRGNLTHETLSGWAYVLYLDPITSTMVYPNAGVLSQCHTNRLVVPSKSGW
jgi:carboxypeptidase C (cathepsin A)